MAKKQKKTNSTSGKTVTLNNKFFAFWGLVFAGAAILLGGIFGAVGLGIVASIFNLIGAVAILIAIAFPAWTYVKGKGVAWKIIYFVTLLAYVVGAVLGVVPW